MRKHIVTLAAGLALAQFPNGAFAQQTTPAAWAGWARCQVSVQGPGYTDQQTHTWTIEGGAPTAQGAFQIYAGTWSVVGGGSLSRTQGTQILTAQWATNASNISAPIAVFVRASDNRMFIQARHAQLRGTSAIQGYQQLTIAGRPQTPARIAAEAFEWAFPVIAVSAPVPPDRNATASGSTTSPVNGSVGVMQPAGSQGTASCTWQFGQGSAAPAPPPTLTAQAIPTPGTPATQTPPANNPPSTSTPPGSSTPPSSPTGTATPPPVGSAPPGSGAPPPATARLVSVAPTAIEQGVNVSDLITLTGEGTHWQPGVTTVDFGAGISPGHVNVTSPTTLTMQVSVGYQLGAGPRPISVTTGNEIVTLPNALTIVAREPPVVTQISPNSAPAGAQNVSVTFTGRGTRWEQGKTMLLLHNAPGVTEVSNLRVDSPTSMTVSLNIAASAALGPRPITVLNSGVVVGSDIINVPGGFTVSPPRSPLEDVVAVPINPGILPTPVICTLRGPGGAQTNYVTPKAARLHWTLVAGATGYSVSRRDLGVLTPTPLAAGIANFVDRRMEPHPMSYVYTITAHYPQGCGSTIVTLNTQPPSTPPVSYEAGSGVGSVRLRWGVAFTNELGQARDSDGILITGPALPPTGREVPHSSFAHASGSAVITGVPAGSRTWTLKAYWNTTYGRVMDNTGRTITVIVP
jgi:hypothetical protein